MIAKGYISSQLDSIERLYNNAPTPRLSLTYAKLAIMELGGWLEMSMDDICLSCMKRHYRDKTLAEKFEKEVIRPIYGFEYEKHFMRMMMDLIGKVNVDRVEKNIDTLIFSGLQSELATFKTIRNVEAHTYIKGTTKIIDSPTVTKTRFIRLYDGLKAFDDALRSMSF